MPLAEGDAGTRGLLSGNQQAQERAEFAVGTDVSAVPGAAWCGGRPEREVKEIWVGDCCHPDLGEGDQHGHECQPGQQQCRGDEISRSHQNQPVMTGPCPGRDASSERPTWDRFGPGGPGNFLAPIDDARESPASRTPADAQRAERPVILLVACAVPSSGAATLPGSDPLSRRLAGRAEHLLPGLLSQHFACRACRLRWGTCLVARARPGVLSGGKQKECQP